MSLRVVVVGIASGFGFAVLDAVLNANPVAKRLYAVYQPIARDSVNAPLGLAFAPALPGAPLAKGPTFGLIVCFFRLAMSVGAQAVMFKVPAEALAYALDFGLRGNGCARVRLRVVPAATAQEEFNTLNCWILRQTPGYSTS